MTRLISFIRKQKVNINLVDRIDFKFSRIQYYSLPITHYLSRQMHISKSNSLSQPEKITIFNLWNAEYADHLAHADVASLDAYFEKLEDVTYYLLKDDEEDVKGWAITFDREDERWFAIIISEKLQGKGYGNMMMDRIKQDEPVLNGWVTDHIEDIRSDGRPYLSPIDFYIKNDFVVLENTRFEKGRLKAVKIRWTRP